MKSRKIVTIGGGTGSFTLLSGLKKYPVDISAIVSMADDGGSTGVLRDELGVLPPGDVRQCLVALSESSDQLRELMNYRFENGDGLRGHSFGNLFLSALEKVNGSFARGVEQAMEILKVKGEVVPVTDQSANLELHLGDGRILRGENEINHCDDFQSSGVRELRFSGPVKVYEKALRRVGQADMIVIGPGNLYCSLLPNLIIPEFAQAIRSARARVVYICNLTNKRGHTIGWSVDEYASAIERYIGQGRIDYVIHNAKKPLPELVARYEEQEGRDTLVEFEPGRNSERNYRLVRANVVSNVAPRFSKTDAIALTRSFIRHDPSALSQAIMFLLDIDANDRLIREII